MPKRISTLTLLSILATLVLASFVFQPAGAAPQACATGPLTGTINADESWCIENSPYTMTGDVVIAAGTTVTVETGVVIEVHTQVRGDGKLTVNGTLNAQGESLDPVIFTSGYTTPAEADWSNIVFSPGSSGTLTYTIIEYGSGFSAGDSLEIHSSSVTVQNSTIGPSDGNGIYIKDASPTLNSVLLGNNNGSALWLEGSSHPQLSGLLASGNNFDGVIIDDGTVAQDYTWGDGGLSDYRLRADTVVSEGATLTVAPGTTVAFRTPVKGDGRLTVHGTLKAEGSAGSPIVFTTGWDSIAKGDWESIIFTSSSSNNILDYVTVEYGGAGVLPSVQMNTGSVTIRNSTIARSLQEGIEVTAGSPTVTTSNIIQNDDYGLRNRGEEVVRATCNWWGDPSGPTATANPNGSGQQVSDGVDFDPWLVATAPGGACSGTVPHIYLPLVIGS